MFYNWDVLAQIQNQLIYLPNNIFLGCGNLSSRIFSYYYKWIIFTALFDGTEL